MAARLPSTCSKTAAPPQVTHRRNNSARRKHRSSSGRKPKQQQEPFLVTVIKVGSTLLMLCGVMYLVFFFSWSSKYYNAPEHQYYRKPVRERLAELSLMEEEENVVAQNRTSTLQPIDRIQLGKASIHDVYGIASTFLVPTDITSKKMNDASIAAVQGFLREAEMLRTVFANQYGGEHAARVLLQQSLPLMHADAFMPLQNLAKRIERAQKTSGTFHMAFAGTSSVAGYGNHHHQAYPFVAETLLSEAFAQLEIKLTVTNAGLNGVSTFPYGWCLENFFGPKNVDVVSWDFGITTPESVEAFIRQAVTRYDNGPMMIFRDTPKGTQRREMIQTYVNAGILSDSLLVQLHSTPLDTRWPGFQNWTEFGAPPGATVTKSRQNLSVKQHELVGWLIAMHILNAMQLVAANILEPNRILDGKESHLQNEQSISALPPPFSESDTDRDPWTSLLHGSPSNNKNDKSWRLNTMHCRTLVEPTVSGSLQELVVSGTAADYVDILLPKGPMFYNTGWVPDLDRTEKTQRQRLKEWDFLGFVDMQKAYYGVPASGPLRLALPIMKEELSKKRKLAMQSASQKTTRGFALRYLAQEQAKEKVNMGLMASHYFQSLMVCESSTPRGENGCNLQSDVTYTVGGVKADQVETIDTDVVSYFGKRLCVLVGIPANAKLTTSVGLEECLQI